MYRTITILLCSFLLQSCLFPFQQVYVKEFKWTIGLQRRFKKIANDEWKQASGQIVGIFDVIYSKRNTNPFESTHLYLLKKDGLNYFNVCSRTASFINEEAFLVDFEADCERIYQLFAGLLPDVSISKSFSWEEIDGFKFRNFHLWVLYPDGSSMSLTRLNRLFDQKELSINLIYTDKEHGEAMHRAIKRSAFNL